MKQYTKRKPSRTRLPYLITLIFGFFLVMSGITPLVTHTALILSANTNDTHSSSTSKSLSHNVLSKSFQNFTMEGEADLGAFFVGDDGSMTSTMIAAGNVGDFDTAGDHYSLCVMSMGIFRWGDYQEVFNYLIGILMNDTSGGGSTELEQILAFLDLFPPNALIMIFMGGSPAQIQTWGNLIHLEFESTMGLPFERITGIPPLQIGETIFAVEAYGFFGGPGPDPVEIQGRDGYQSYMLNLGSVRNGASELVTPALAADSIGGVGINGFLNLAAFGEPPTAGKAALQAPTSVTFASWASHHQDKFYGSEEQTFDVNEFCDRTGTISMGSLEAFEFSMIFPLGVNITYYEPADMMNSTTPQGELVLRNTTQWQAVSTVPNIIVKFEGDFPPGLTIIKEITPWISVGGTATVNITLTNIDNETIFDLSVDDSHSWDAYAGFAEGRFVIEGSMTGAWTSIDPNESVSLLYTVTIAGEGSYISGRANLTYYDDAAQQWDKTSNKVYVIVGYLSIFDFLLTLLRDIPWSIPVLLIIGLMLFYAIIWLIKAILGLRGPSRARAPPPSAPPKEPPPLPEEGPPPPEEYDTPSPKAYPETTCINCGSPLPPGVGFCPACGTKIPE